MTTGKSCSATSGSGMTVWPKQRSLSIFSSWKIGATDGRIGNMSAVLRVLHWSIVVKRELS